MLGLGQHSAGLHTRKPVAPSLQTNTPSSIDFLEFNTYPDQWGERLCRALGARLCSTRYYRGMHLHA